MPITSPQQFDEFHVISDLHIGGQFGFQIFQQGPLLADLIDSLIQPASTKRIGLCINGDTVDFLAEPDARCFDPHHAREKLDRIFKDAAFEPVWDALRRFVAVPNRRLILTLGNHDLELALPWVQEHLLDLLSLNKDDARGRITVSFGGTGYSCTVGGKSILCLHGNEFDPWNVTDFETIRRIGRDLMQGRPVEDWTPNAGTKLVIEVMNELKRKFAFVDVLKPEVEAVLPILWILDEATRSRLRGVISVSRRLAWDAIKQSIGLLTADRARPDQPLDPSRPVYRSLFDANADTAELLDWAEHQLEEGIEPLSLAYGSSDQLGIGGAIWDRMRGRSRHEQAWEALKELTAATTLDLQTKDATYERADGFVDPGVDFLITGHTHQARSRPRGEGSGHYFNAGTWATLMQLSPEQLGSAESFKAVFERLAAARNLGSLADLVTHRPTVVSIRNEAGITRAALAVVEREDEIVKLKELHG